MGYLINNLGCKINNTIISILDIPLFGGIKMNISACETCHACTVAMTMLKQFGGVHILK